MNLKSDHGNIRLKLRILREKQKTNKQTNKKRSRENRSEERNTSIVSWIFACENETTDFSPRIFCPLKFKWRWNILAACVYLWVKLASILFLSTVFCVCLHGYWWHLLWNQWEQGPGESRFCLLFWMCVLMISHPTK